MTRSDPTPREADVTGRPSTAVLGTSLAEALVPFVTAAGGHPFLTFIDGDDRTELSVATIGNWASKFANLLLADVDEAATVELRTDGHWCAGVAAVGSWRVGVSVRPATADEGAAPPVTGPSFAGLRIAHERTAGPDDLAVGDGFGGRLTSPDRGQRSFVDEVLAEPDEVDAGDPDPCAVAVRWGTGDGNGDGEVVDLSLVAAGLDGMAGARALLLDPLDSPAGLAALAAAVVHSGSLVVVRAWDDALLNRIAAAERVDVAVGSQPRLAEGLDRPLLFVPLE